MSFYFDGTDHLRKRIFSNRTIVGYSLDVQETPVGLKADLPQLWQRLAGKRLGLLINFNVALIKDGITRIANGMPD